MFIKEQTPGNEWKAKVDAQYSTPPSVWGHNCCGTPFVVSVHFELEPKLRLKIVNKHSLRRRLSFSIPYPPPQPPYLPSPEKSWTWFEDLEKRNWEWPRHTGICVSSHRYVLVRRVLGSALTWNCNNAILWPKKGNKHTHETNVSLFPSFSEGWISALALIPALIKTEPSHYSWYYSSKAVLMANRKFSKVTTLVTFRFSTLLLWLLSETKNKIKSQ